MTEYEPIAKIDLLTYTEAEDIEYIIDQLGTHAPYKLEYVHDPNEEEPDFYLCAEVEEDES